MTDRLQQTGGAPGQQRQPDPGEQAQMARKHVFCVNGSSSFLEFVRMLLEEEDYNVTTTNFVPATFVQIAAVQPDLLIVDLAVGRQAGWNLLSQVREDEQTRGIPLIVVSTDARTLEEARQAAIGARASYIPKPFNIDDLLAAVREHIGPA